ncbi:MAG: hypothetical protein QM713_04040 [Arachnia sp.]
MRAHRVLATGWVEACIGALWVALSAVGLLSGRVPLTVFGWDLATLGALLLTLRWPLVGMWAVGGLALGGLWVDPEGLGLSLYITACAVILAVHRGRARAALLLSIGVLAAMAIVMRGRSASMADYASGVVGAVAVVAVGWLVGLGFRWVARVEAERVSKAFLERQMRMAVDIHDFVGRNLAGVLARADGATVEQQSDPAFLDELVHRVRTADATLREVTADLQREGSARPFRTVGAADALRAGVAELAAAGMEVRQNPEADVLLAGLPPEVDLVVSRIVAEALHNVLVHGDKSVPCKLEATRDGDILSIVVTNGVRHRRLRSRPSLGLVGMQRHAALAGGAAVSQADRDSWVCRVTIPIDREGIPT